CTTGWLRGFDYW
nr:immunoglobulin heavy chain junction region [Mus musculus]NSM04734.1 immunoglobulin heavy chain junction region [Mus musculus]NSM05121.1 immunoglobulin heavy chain junction region [Mus musculus]NSM05792.1 immunoglobulin heavy chain junction region [Mus musculus]NSM05864.1 immunoglobulin heavy chain junction region [Mus musculus]